MTWTACQNCAHSAWKSRSGRDLADREAARRKGNPIGLDFAPAFFECENLDGFSPCSVYFPLTFSFRFQLVAIILLGMAGPSWPVAFLIADRRELARSKNISDGNKLNIQLTPVTKICICKEYT